LIGLVRKLIQAKKFVRYLVDNRYPIAINGSQIVVGNALWIEECLEPEVKKGDDSQRQYYVSVLEY
jgi:hypothetical protein